MSAPTPVTRDYMRNLKAKNDEMKRLAEIENCIKYIYGHAINTATNTNYTSYQFQIQEYNFGRNGPDFMRTNKQDILRGLQCLFQDCTVEFTQLSRAQDGKMYDISKIDEKILPFIKAGGTQDCIVIDWS
jgi:hypothetical protein